MMTQSTNVSSLVLLKKEVSDRDQDTATADLYQALSEEQTYRETIRVLGPMEKMSSSVSFDKSLRSSTVVTSYIWITESFGIASEPPPSRQISQETMKLVKSACWI